LVTRDTPLTTILTELDDGGCFADATFGHLMDMTAEVQFSEYYEDTEA
jgi:hypothetical protein